MSKKNRRRYCPALNREITSQECGADRQSRIACTADCPFNTFTVENYDDFGEMESNVLAKCRDRLMQSLPGDRRFHFLENARRVADDLIKAHYLFQQEFFRRRDQQGRDFFDRWEAEGWTGLNNDERVYIQGHRRMQPALLEIQCVLDSERVQAVNLLEPERGPFVIVDRSVAGSARRFQTVIVWIFPQPHYIRSSGAGILTGPLGPCDALESLVEISKHLGGPADAAGLTEWLWENFAKVQDAIGAVMAARRVDSMRLTDTKQGTAIYGIDGSFAELGEVLEEDPAIEETDLADGDIRDGFERRYHVFDRDAAAMPEQVSAMPGDPMLGSIALGKRKAKVEAGTGARFVRLKAHLELVAGHRVTFLSEQIEDRGAQMAGRAAGTWDPELVPPRLLEQPQILHMQASRVPILPPEAGEENVPVELRMLRAAQRGYIDTRIPALNGLTPREAAADPAMRPRLVRLMKQHVRSVDDMRYGRRLDLDINDQLAELGLHELIFPPPPLPEAGEEDGWSDEDTESDEWEEEDGHEDSRPAWSLEEVMARFSPQERKEFSLPPPLRAVLNHEDIVEGMEALTEGFPTAEEALEYFESEWESFVAALDTATTGILDDPEFMLLEVQAARAALFLFPGGPPAAPVNERRLAFYIASEIAAAGDAAGSISADVLQRYIDDSPQPCLVGTLCGQLITLFEEKKAGLTAEGLLKLIPLAKAVIRELCQLPRR